MYCVYENVKQKTAPVKTWFSGFRDEAVPRAVEFQPLFQTGHCDKVCPGEFFLSKTDLPTPKPMENSRSLTSLDCS